MPTKNYQELKEEVDKYMDLEVRCPRCGQKAIFKMIYMFGICLECYYQDWKKKEKK